MCYEATKKKKTLNNNESTNIKHIRKKNKSNNTQSICPFKQSLKEKELQLMNQSFIPFIPFPLYDLHKTMRDHASKHLYYESIKLA